MGIARRARARIGRTPTMIIAAVTTVTAVACSSGTSGGTATGPTGQASAATSACMAKANAFLKPWASLATSLSADYAKLPAAPPHQGTIVTMEEPMPTSMRSAQAQVAAAKTIGWKGEIVQYNGTVEDLNQKLTQVIQQKPTIITISGIPMSAIQHPVQEARAAGVIIVGSDITDTPTTYPGFAGVFASTPTYHLEGELNAYQFMKDSGCQGHVAIFDIPYPILKVGADAFRAVVEKNCPDCRVSYNLIQSSDINTPTATQAVVSKLQSDPSAKYLFFTNGDTSLGVASALRQAGLTGIKMFGVDPSDEDSAGLRSGENGWWVDQSSALEGWMGLYVGLRALETKAPVHDTTHYPLGILTPANIGSGSGTPTVPADYQAQFEKLW